MLLRITMMALVGHATPAIQLRHIGVYGILLLRRRRLRRRDADWTATYAETAAAACNIRRHYYSHKSHNILATGALRQPSLPPQATQKMKARVGLPPPLHAHGDDTLLLSVPRERR